MSRRVGAQVPPAFRVAHLRHTPVFVAIAGSDCKLADAGSGDAPADAPPEGCYLGPMPAVPEGIERLGWDGTFHDGDPFVTRDGDELFFGSTRSGGSDGAGRRYKADLVWR
jgi:hypothetical protein